MEKVKSDNALDKNGIRLPSRLVGAFILWATMAAVGWSFYSTMQHDKLIALQGQRLDLYKNRIDRLEERCRHLSADINELRKDVHSHEPKYFNNE